MNPPKQQLSVGEFATLSAVLFSLVALSIDAMLPALPMIAADLKVQNINDAQLVIGIFFLGNAFGQLLFGPLSDTYGRKPVIIAGLLLFLCGCLISIFAQSFMALLLGRVLQGLGSAGPRTVTMSMIRDLYSGSAMARIMSISMAIFILVPTVAPAMGQVILWIASWRAIFIAFLVMALIALLWFTVRQGETLPQGARRPFDYGTLVSGMLLVVRSRQALGYTLAMGAIFSPFLGFLSSAQQIFQDALHVGEAFPLWFGALALTIGLSSLLNSYIVQRYGMDRIVRAAFLACTSVSVGYVVLAWLVDAGSLMFFMGWGLAAFFAIGMIFGNLNALAMEPLGEVAGLGAAMIGFFSTIISLILGVPIGLAFNGTATPLVFWFAVFSFVGWALVRRVSR